jgi:hypothetical protein
MKPIHVAVLFLLQSCYHAHSLQTHERAAAFIGYNEHESAGKLLMLGSALVVCLHCSDSPVLLLLSMGCIPSNI